MSAHPPALWPPTLTSWASPTSGSAVSQGPRLTLDLPGDPTHSWRPRLLGWIPVPAGAAGGPWGLHCSPDGLLFLTAGTAPCIHVLDL